MAKSRKSRHEHATLVIGAGTLSRAERYAKGKALRSHVPREEHGKWTPSPHRRNPVDLVIESSEGRVPELVPIRNGRMLRSPFTFYRGAANVMAADLATTPVTGIHAQICGDCHLLNLGCFATPERRLIVDINDFDETLPGPWEWDVKRLAASFVLACQSNGFSKEDQREAALACVHSYRKWTARYADMPALDVWYASIDITTALERFHDAASVARMRKRLEKAASRTAVEHDFPNMVDDGSARYRIRDAPPLIYHHPILDLDANRSLITDAFSAYRSSLADDRKVLLDRYQLVDLALKVVGVGSVGTLCAVMLMMAEHDDPLFLQVKEARASVLEPHLGKSAYHNHGHRVVVGQRLMQAASDIFLGWTEGQGGRHFYLRQLRDIKIKPLVEIFNPSTMLDYAALCGWTLARAHARSGDAAMIAGYLGKNDVFDRAIARFSLTYADLTARDHREFVDASRAGRIEVQSED